MQRLHLPAALDELYGQPVEQLGMRGSGTEMAEVVGCGDDALAEVALPDAVDENAGRQRMIRARQPLCPRGAPVAARRPGSCCDLDGAVRLGQYGKVAGRHFGPGRQMVAPSQQVRRRRLVQLPGRLNLAVTSLAAGLQSDLFAEF